MLVEPLTRHLAVASLRGALEMARRERGFWNVISILSPDVPKPPLAGAKRVLGMTFDDIPDELPTGGWTLAHPTAISEAFGFWDKTDPEPLLIHCMAGLSRSAGLALALITRDLWGIPDLEHAAPEILLQIRPQACPNGFVVTLGLRQFLDEVEAAAWASRLMAHPRFAQNRIDMIGRARWRS